MPRSGSCFSLALCFAIHWRAALLQSLVATTASADAPLPSAPLSSERPLHFDIRFNETTGTQALNRSVARDVAGRRPPNNRVDQQRLRRGKRKKEKTGRTPGAGVGSRHFRDVSEPLPNKANKSEFPALEALQVALRHRVESRVAVNTSHPDKPEFGKDGTERNFGKPEPEVPQPEDNTQEQKAEDASLEPLVDEVVGAPSGVSPEEAWKRMRHTSRHSRNPEATKKTNPKQFVNSAETIDCWGFFCLAVLCYVLLHRYLFDWPSTTHYHGIALAIWLGVGMCYIVFVALRIGQEAAHVWAAGYLLELIFSIENVFVFHIVISAFKTPRRQVQKALFIVVCCQSVFQMVFYMGLAHRLRSMQVLPYCLGAWLIYIGVESMRGHGAEATDVKEMRSYWLFERLLGDSLRPEYEETGSLVITRNDRRYVTLLGVTAVCLLSVDFFLEVDVTLTKIENLDNEYLAFTSSVTAGFAMPELFFIARDLFRRYRLLQYGVSFALLLFGTEMICWKIIEVSELLSCTAIFAVMCLLVALSAFTSIGSNAASRDRMPQSGIWG